MSRRSGALERPWTHGPATWPEGPFDVSTADWPHARAAVETAARIAGRAEQRRRELGYSRREVGKRAGLSVQTVGNVEQGTVWPDLVTLVGIAVALDMDLSELVALAG